MGTQTGRRVVRVPVSPDLLMPPLHQGAAVPAMRCTHGLPLGARCVFTSFDNFAGTVYFWYEHESFEEIPWHSEAPVFYVVFEQVQ